MFKTFNLDRVYQCLLIMLAFLMPITVFGANVIIVIICTIWLFSGNYKSKYIKILNSKLMIASLIFFGLHIISLSWSDDIIQGFKMAHKMWYFGLLLPILFCIVKVNNVKYYLMAFVSAIFFTVILSFLIRFQLIDLELGFRSLRFFESDNHLKPNVFMSHISYNPLLSLAIYLVLHLILFSKNLGKLRIFLGAVFGIYGI